MSKYLFILIVVVLQQAVPSYSQCLSRDSLYKRLIGLTEYSGLPTSEQVTELLGYESTAESCHYNRDSLWSLLLHRIGSTYYKLAEYDRSEIYTLRAIEAVRKNKDPSFAESRLLVRCYFTLSAIYQIQNKPVQKSVAEDSCISIALRAKYVDIYAVNILEKKVGTLCDIGDYHRCIEYAEEGEFICASYFRGRDSLQYSTSFFFWKVNALYLLNELNAAEKLLNEKDSLFTKTGITAYQHVLFERMASIQTQKNNYPAAIQFYQKALALEIKNKHSLIGIQTYVNMGFYLYFMRLHDADHAMTCYRNALHLGSSAAAGFSTDDSIELKVQRMNIYANMANLFVYKNKFDSADFYFKKAYAIELPGYEHNPSFSTELTDRSTARSAFFILSTMIDEAGSQLKKYHFTKDKKVLEKAAFIYSLANRLQSRINLQQENVQSRLFWRNNIHKLYEGAIETHYLLNQPDRVFYYFEKSRAVLLGEQLKRNQNLKAEEIYRLYALRQKDLQLNVDLKDLKPGSAGYSNIRTKLFENSQELSRLDETLKIHNRFYYQSILDTHTVQISDIQENLLKKQGAMLEIFNGDSSVFAILITMYNIYLRQIKKSEYEQTTRYYINTLSSSVTLNTDYDRYVHNSNHLYELFFSGIPLPNGQIIISPDGQYFPFESLVTRVSEGQPTYFIENHSVSYTYSAGFLLSDFYRNETQIRGNLLGIAPVRYPSSFNLSSLILSDASLEKIGAGINNKEVLYSTNATRANFMQQFQDYKIIQLYTHASDSSSRGEPVIYFSDSALYLSELIPENKTATQLIVLSACETGNGKLYQGEGVFSFNRGFAALGIPSSVINLWSVDDESTYKLTELFYKYVGEGLPLDEALQRAKLDFIKTSSKEKRLPYYWAAAILAGKTDPVIMSRGTPWGRIGWIAGVLFIGIAVILVRRKLVRTKARI